MNPKSLPKWLTFKRPFLAQFITTIYNYHLGKKAELPFSLNTDLSKGFTIAQRELTASEGIGTENKEQVAVQITV